MKDWIARYTRLVAEFAVDKISKDEWERKLEALLNEIPRCVRWIWK